MSDEDVAPSYTLQYTNRFFEDIRKGWEHFRLNASEEIAEEWQESLIRAVVGILENPYGYPLVAEHERFRKPVRRLLHRRTPTSAAYRVLFFIEESVRQPDGTMTTAIVVIASLHSSARPLSVRKARELENLG